MARTLAVVLLATALALGLALGLKAAYADPAWPNGEPALQLSFNGYNRYSGMAQSQDGTIGVVWSRLSPTGTEPRWLTLTQRTASGWQTPITLRQVMTNINAPAVAYLGSTWHVAWIEGKYLNAARLMALSADQPTTPQVIHTGLYLYPAPAMVSAANGLHMVYAASESSADQGNLYYTFYASGGTGWSTPTTLITSSQVVAGGQNGSIWRARIATNALGTEVHIVWEQHIYPAGSNEFEIWYVKGTRTGQTLTLETPKRISPQGQYATLPDIALDRQGGVHIIWTELLSPLSSPSAQYIDYRRNLGSEWSIPTRIDSNPAVASNLNPTYIQSALAVGDQRICVAWHASRDRNDKEELLLTCSQDGGSTWQTTVNVSNSPELLSLFPNVLFTRQGTVMINWLESHSTDWMNDYDVYVREEKARLFKLFLPVAMRNKA